MLKFVGILLIILASVGIAYSRSRELVAREKNLEDFLQVILCLKGEIRCGNSSLPDAFRDTARRCTSIYQEFLTKTAENMEKNMQKNVAQLIHESARKYLCQEALSREELEKISSLGEKLGYLDREMQIRQLELYEQDFQQMIGKLKETIPGKLKIYRSLGIMGGMMLVILFW